MADNTTLNAGSGGDSIATDDIGGVKYPRSKIVIGADGVNGGDVSSSNPMPVTGTGTAGTAATGVVTVQGIASGVAIPVSDNGSTLSIDDGAGSITVDGTVAVSGTVAITDNSGSITVDDGAGSLTVDGTVAATQSGTWTVQVGNTANTTPILASLHDGTTKATVRELGTNDALNVAIVDGAGNQVTSFGGSGGTSATDDAAFTAASGSGTPIMAFATSDSVDSGDVGVVAMTTSREMKVQATNAGTFAVQVDGSALTALQLIDNIVLAEDAGHSTGDPGVQMLAVRNDSDTSLAGTTLDYTPLQVDSNGYLKVNIKAGAGSGGTASTDDGAFTAASGSGTPMMGFVTSDSVDSGDVGVVGMLANRQLKVTLYDSSGVEAVVGSQYTEGATDASITGSAILWEDTGDTLSTVSAAKPLPIGDAGGSITVDGTVAATQSGTWTVQPGNTANTTAWLVTGTGGTFPVTDSGGSLTVDNGGTFAVQATVAAGATTIGKAEDVASADADVGVPAMAIQRATPADLAGTDGDYAMLQMSAGRLWCHSQVVGQVAHDAADSGNPVKIGANTHTTLSTITLVADSDRTDLHAGVDGVLITRPHTLLEDIVTATPVAITDGSSTSVISAAGAGIKIYITEVIIANSSSTNVTVDLRDGTAGSVKATFPVPANGGVVKTLSTPLPFSANTAVAADPSASASTITVTLIGFKSKI